MRTTTMALACFTLVLGIGTANAQTSSPGGSPSTGPASGISPGRATSLSPMARTPSVTRGLPANPGLSGEAGGRPILDRLDSGMRGGRSMDAVRRRLPDSIRTRRANRMLPGESTDRFPSSRLLPLRPGSPADLRRFRSQPPGLESEASRSAAERRALRRTGADYTQRECEQIWDSGTGMNRQQWSASCRRVGERMRRLQLTQPPRSGPSLRPAPRETTVLGSPSAAQSE
jgi:hypothetical protein